MSAVLNVKEAGAWKCMNFNGNDVRVKDGGVWVTPTTVRVKDGGAWVIVWPSTSTASTTANASTAVTAEATSAKPQIVTYAVNSAEWSGRSTSEGEGVQFSDFNWSPTTTVGFTKGAIKTITVTFRAYQDANPPSGSNFIRVRATTGSGTYMSSNALVAGSYQSQTLTGTPAAWGITDEQAGNLHLTDSAFRVTPKFNNATQGFDTTVIVDTFKVQLEYYYN